MESNLDKFECVDADEQVYADYSARFGKYNQDGSGWQVQTFSMILRDGESITAGGRGHIYLGALELRGL